MFERSVECPRCKVQITLGFWDYSPTQGYQHVYCPGCGGESKFGLKARLGAVAAIASALLLGYLCTFFVNSYVALIAVVLAFPVLFAAFSRPFVTLEPTDVGQKLQRMQPFYIFMAIVVLCLAALKLFGFRP
jgi:hypothetical protein